MGFVHLLEAADLLTDAHEVIVQELRQVVRTEVLPEALGAADGQGDLPGHVRRTAKLKGIDHDVPLGHDDMLAQARPGVHLCGMGVSPMAPRRAAGQWVTA